MRTSAGADGEDMAPATKVAAPLVGLADPTRPKTPLLDSINHPMHMKNLGVEQLKQLAQELRQDIIHTVSKTGGHLSSSLGVADLTVALHYVFNTGKLGDRLIFDVGHQSYGHKILTGRRDRMHTIRQGGGLSGFQKRAESEHDAFGAGHSGTSISSALGFAVGRDLKGGKNHCIAVIGDGAITGGMAYEAMNNAGFLDSNLLVVLNDNNQVSLPTPGAPVGALSGYFSRLQSNTQARELREVAKGFTKSLGAPVHEVASKIDEYARGVLSTPTGTTFGATMFEELGLYYIGPVDGHNMDELVAVLENIKNTEARGPVLLHVVTEKGMGYRPAMQASDKMHGVVKYDVATGRQFKPPPGNPAYTNVFADSLTALAKKDRDIVAIHAAMGGGTGLNRFEAVFPNRCFDVGIAEQHAVTFAAGLAAEGLKPFCAIYSTFLQRGYDQVQHDVDLQKLPVRFAMDRAGLVGADGSTHAGTFDVAFLGCLPNMVLMAPSDEAELCDAIATAYAIDDGPSAFRYPRGTGTGVPMPEDLIGTPWELGRGKVLRQGTDVALLAYGTKVKECLEAAEALERMGVSCTVADARFAKPLDTDLVNRLAKEHLALVTIEEGSVGGFGSFVLHHLASTGRLDSGLKIRPMVLPDRYIDHNSPAVQQEQAGLTASAVMATALSLVGKEAEARAVKNGVLL